MRRRHPARDASSDTKDEDYAVSHGGIIGIRHDVHFRRDRGGWRTISMVQPRCSSIQSLPLPVYP